jgi:hypothetical protein
MSSRSIYEPVTHDSHAPSLLRTYFTFRRLARLAIGHNQRSTSCTARTTNAMPDSAGPQLTLATHGRTILAQNPPRARTLLASHRDHLDHHRAIMSTQTTDPPELRIEHDRKSGDRVKSDHSLRQGRDQGVDTFRAVSSGEQRTASNAMTPPDPGRYHVKRYIWSVKALPDSSRYQRVQCCVLQALLSSLITRLPHVGTYRLET